MPSLGNLSISFDVARDMSKLAPLIVYTKIMCYGGLGHIAMGLTRRMARISYIFATLLDAEHIFIRFALCNGP